MGTSIRTDTVSGCAGDTVTINIKTENFNGVGSMTLYLGYDPSELIFDTITYKNPFLPGMLVNEIHTSSSFIGFAWFSATMIPAYLGNSTIASLKFILISENSQLWFLPGCEVTDSAGQPIATQFTGSPVMKFQIPVSKHPSDVYTTLNGNASFSLTTILAPVGYQWQISANMVDWVNLANDQTISGVNNSTLEINNVADTLFNKMFRCILYYGNCIDVSNPATLLKDTTSNISNERKHHSKETLPYPNPFKGHLYVPMIVNPSNYSTFALHDITGRVVYRIEVSKENIHDSRIFIDNLELQSGLYIATIKYVDSLGQNTQFSHPVIAK